MAVSSTWSASADGILPVNARVWTAAGAASGGLIVASAGAASGRKEAARVTGPADGGFAVAAVRYQPRTGGDIWTRRFDAEGTPRGPGGIAHAANDTGEREPAIAARPGGGDALVWSCGGGWLRLFEADGTPRGDAARFLGGANFLFRKADQRPPVAALAEGRIVIAGQDCDVEADIWHTIVDPRGAAIMGTLGDDVLFGNALDNGSRGGESNDRLQGGGGADVLAGGDGDGVLTGGTGRDTFTGGAGADVFAFAPGDSGATRTDADRIADFAPGEDRLDLPAVAPFLSVNPGGTRSGIAGQVAYLRADRLVVVDIDSDGAADFALRLDNRPAALDAGDFIP